MTHLSGLSVLIVYLCSPAFASQASPVPSEKVFAHYPAGKLFRGKPHAPLLIGRDAHLFRTRLREGVAKGVSFAGDYETAVWGCGTGCLSFAVIDARSGSVHFFPATVSQDRELGEPLTYKRQSKAIHIIGSLNETNSADRWYVWNGQTFQLVSEKPAAMSEGNGDAIKP